MRQMIHIGLLITVQVLFFSCKEDVDEVPPNITILAPTDGAFIEMPDTIDVSARVEDDNKLEFIAFGLVNEDLVSVGQRISIGSVTNPEEFSFGLEVTDLDIESGVHYVEVVASDGSNDSREFVEVTVQAIPKEFRGVSFKSTSSSGSVLNFIDVQGVTSSLVSASSSIAYSVSSRLNTVSAYDLTENTLTNFSIEDGFVEWSQPDLLEMGESLISIQNDPFLRRTVILTDLPRIISFSRSGFRTGDIKLSNEWNPLTLFIDEEDYWIGSEVSSGHRVSKVFKSSGFEVDFFTLSEAPVRMARLSDDEMIVVDGEGDVRILNSVTGGQFSVPSAADSSPTDLQVTDEAAYFSSGDKLFRYSTTQFQAPEVYSVSGLNSISYDEVGQRLILCTDNGALQFFLLNPFQGAGEVSIPINSSDIQALFNK